MSPKIRLIYFNSRGRAEPIRYILAQAGCDYEDHRIQHEEWPEMKPKIPFGQLPAVEYNGEFIPQSMAIARFMAREFNLGGKTNLEMAKADFVVECISDCLNKIVPVYHEKDEAKKAEMVTKFLTEDLATFFKYLTSYMKINGGCFLIGKELTYADLVFASVMEGLSGLFGDQWKKMAPELVQLSQKVYELPNIKKWRETRPSTDN
eukprot:maker-scaffold139_size317827-snap-gene-0.16 protein:Tk05005 transcript:maker-scaffold139_size317827-snap-gene-0.16-mRNA-1 annotation:"hypothetical protein DAPPUDRAFT_230761"